MLREPPEPLAPGVDDDADGRDVLRPEFSVERRPVPGFPSYLIGDDLAVWHDRRAGHDPRFSVPDWVRLGPQRVSGSEARFVRLRHAGREQVRSVALLYRAAFSPRPDLWASRIGPKPPRPSGTPRKVKADADAPLVAAEAPPAPPSPPRLAGPVELKVIPEFPLYAIGSDRSVWSRYAYGRGVPDPSASPEWRRRALSHGGERVYLWRDGRKVNRGVEDLYRAAFGGEPSAGPGALRACGPYQETLRGSAHGMARLDESKVTEARRLRREGWTYGELAGRYGVTSGAIRPAVKGETWRHVPMEPPAGR